MTVAEPFVFRWGDERGLRSWAKAVDETAVVVLDVGDDERWLALDAPDSFADWARVVTGATPSCRRWVTVRNLNRWPVERYLRLPRLATGRLLRAFDHQLAGHVLATAVIGLAAPGSDIDPGHRAR